MGLKYTNFFDNSKYEASDIKIIICRGCSSHLCLSDLIISDNFSGSSGPAYLVDKLINYEFDSRPQETPMKTGTYLINKIRCHQCHQPLGWYYKKAYSYAETYKERKYVIENKYILFIPNNSSTDILVEQALQNKIRRRYSSTSTISNESLDPPDFKKERELSGGIFLNRLRIPGFDKGLEENDEEDEDADVFVDA